MYMYIPLTIGHDPDISDATQITEDHTPEIYKRIALQQDTGSKRNLSGIARVF